MMLKRWAIVAVLSLGAVAIGDPQDNRNDHKEVAKRDLSPTITTVDNSTRQPEANSSTEKPPESHAGIEWSNWALVLIGGAGVITAYCTLRRIGQQTKATRIAAEAALKQANHMVAAERAWIMAEAKFEHGGGLVRVGDETQAIVELSILNAGPTPAWIYEQWVQLKVSPEVIMSRTQYQSPQFPFVGEGRFAHVNYEIHPVTQGQSPITWKAYIRDKGIPTEENGLHVYIFGVVRYRDVFSSSRETYFGYSVKANKRLERIPNEAYNKHI